MAYLLHIETSTKACSVGISFKGVIKAIREINSDGFQHAELVTVYIEELLQELNHSLDDLDAVAVTSGPGSYTGLRIGIATAKGLCYACNKPLIAVDSLSSLTQQLVEENITGNICAAIDARRMEVFSTVSDNNGSLMKLMSADIVDENSYAEFEPFCVVGDASAKLEAIWSHRAGVMFRTTIHASVKGQAKLAYHKFLKQEFEDVAYFEPLYLKEFFSGK